MFGHLARDGHLPADWLDGRSRRSTGAEGDIDTLMQRLSGVRVWSYIAARRTGCAMPRAWQDRARAVEDKLSDALHEKLTARFVDRRSTQLMRRLEEAEGEALLSAVTARGEVVVEGHSVGHVAGFSFIPDPLAEGQEKRLVLRAARRALRRRCRAGCGGWRRRTDAAFTLGADHRSLGRARRSPGCGPAPACCARRSRC